MLNTEQLNQELQTIKARNMDVESDKSWETSLTRKASLTIFTYLAIGLYLNAINIARPWLNAIVPAVGFMLSTLTLPFLKKLWLKYIYKK